MKIPTEGELIEMQERFRLAVAYIGKYYSRADADQLQDDYLLLLDLARAIKAGTPVVFAV